MSSRLDSKPQIHTLASDLGLKPSNAPTQQILKMLEARIKRISRTFGCKSLNELLAAVAGEVSTRFYEIRSDHDIISLQNEFIQKGELIFATLDQDLSRPDDYGITIGLNKRQPWEPQFVSIIDCRGDKSYRTYFTKWHELAHLLTLTPQMRLLFRRSHSRENSADPEETLMDVIAGTFGFLPDLMPLHARSEISFEGIDQIKREFCPDASLQAATIGIVKAFPHPCILLQAELGLRESEKRAGRQTGFSFGASAPVPVLRAAKATVNAAARNASIHFIPNWRVPPTSVITAVFNDGGYAEADENLDWWTATGGHQMQSIPVRVKAKKVADTVQVLIIPLAA